MKIDKSIKAMPWPEDFHGTLENFKLTLDWPVVDGERLMVATFTMNRDFERKAWHPKSTGEDFRLICSKKRRRAAILKRSGRQGLRWTLERAMRTTAGVSPSYCYPLINERDEKALAKWLKNGETRNHFMEHLDTWVEEALEAEHQAERDARGELRDEDVGLCPDELPDGLIQYIRERVLPQDHVLIYKKGNVRGLCYRCRQKVKALKGYRFKQDNVATCPNCGEKVLAYLEGTDRFKADYVQDIATIQKGTDGRTVFIRQWHLCRDATAQWEHIEDHLDEVARYAIRDNHVAKWQHEAKENWYMNTTRYRLAKWERMTNVTCVYDGEYIFYRPDNWRDVFAGTSLQYCELEEYHRDIAAGKSGNTIRFMMDWARYPAIEKLWKAGYKQLVHEKMRGLMKRHQYAIAWEKDTIQGAVRFPTRLLKRMPPENWNMDDIQKVRELWPEVLAGKIAEREMNDAVIIGLPLKDYEAALDYTTVHKVAKYIEKRREAERDRRAAEDAKMIAAGNKPRYWGPMNYAQTFRDYLRDCVTLNLDLSDRAVLFPADLEAEHQRTIAQIKYKQNEAIREKFRKRAEKLESMAWSKGDLLIRPAHDAGELAAEGHALHHCVGGYATSMAEGATAIFFIREQSAPDRPYYTLELRDGVVIQCRTTQNKSYTNDERVRGFVDAWVEKFVQKKKKKTATAAA